MTPVRSGSSWSTPSGIGSCPATGRPAARSPASAGAGVNPNTVQRALAELDRTGLTSAERTAGRFVTADAAVLDAVRRELATGATDAYVVALTGLGMSLDGATRLLAERWTDRPATGEPQS